MPFKKMREILAYLEIEPVWSELFEFLADQVDHIVWLADDQSKLLYINDYWVEVTGVSKEGAIYRDEWKQCIIPSEVDLIKEMGDQVRSTQDPMNICYSLIDVRTGQIYHVGGHLFPFKDNLGNVRFWLGIVKKV